MRLPDIPPKSFDIVILRREIGKGTTCCVKEVLESNASSKLDGLLVPMGLSVVRDRIQGERS